MSARVSHGVLPSSAGDLADGPTHEPLVLVGEGLEEEEGLPVGQRAGWRPPASGPRLIHVGPALWAAHHGQLLVVGQRHQLVPTREDVEDEAGLEVQPHPEAVGQRQGDDPGAVAGRRVAAVSWWSTNSLFWA